MLQVIQYSNYVPWGRLHGPDCPLFNRQRAVAPSAYLWGWPLAISKFRRRKPISWQEALASVVSRDDTLASPVGLRAEQTISMDTGMLGATPCRMRSGSTLD
jgi:hypothetical protein